MLEAIYLSLALERSGNSMVLNEQSFQAPIYAAAPYVVSAQITLPPKIMLASPPVAYLTIEDQRMFDKALRRSSRLIHKAVPVS